jgi:hypothetical protein
LITRDTVCRETLDSRATSLRVAAWPLFALGNMLASSSFAIARSVQTTSETYPERSSN